jgi:flavodoxin
MSINFAGKYSYLTDTPSGKRETILSVRETARGYEGEVIASHGDCEVMKNIVAKGNTFSFEAQVGPCVQAVTLTSTEDGTFIGSVVVYQDNGTEIAGELENVQYSPKKLRALILYATMTKNTEKIAKAMAETFEYYQWEVTLFKMTMKKEDWKGRQGDLFFDDYDVICLGSPIVAGYPLTVVNKVFSLGAGGQLEKNVQKQVDAGGGFKMNEETMKGPAASFDAPPPPPGPGGPGGPGAGGPPPREIGAQWRRRQCPYPGGPSADNYQPLGVVFTTYGGGFFGSNECRATLAALKLFLELNNVTVIGQYACCGKEFGPAGLAEGEKPRLIGPGEIDDPKVYDTADGQKITASYFFHGQPWNHPMDRDVQKAQCLIADLVEDMFMTYDGKRAQVCSEYISIS